MNDAPGRRVRGMLAVACAVLVGVGLAISLLRHLSHPLLWNDEAETIAYAQRILASGYPRVWDGRNLVYELDAPLDVGVKRGTDAYVGSVWGQYYFATLGVLAARGVDDLGARTLRFRLPFVLAGAVGLAALAAALAAGFAGRREAAAWSVAGFLALALLSTSLLLHLREARYHGLAVGIEGLLVLVYLRREMRGRRGGTGSALATTTLLLLLFNTFPPAAFAWAAAMALDVSWAARRAAPGTRGRRLASGWAPLLGFGLLVLPLLRFYETIPLARYFSEHLGFGPASWLRNGRILLGFLLWHEPLVAVLAVKLVTEGLAHATGDLARDTRMRLRFSRLLGVAALFELLLVSRIPFVFERYALPALPLLAAMLVLDVGLARDLVRARAREARGAAGAALAAALVAGAAFLVPAKADELRGRLAELRTPVLGPLDFVMPRLRALQEDPASLVIATNYETCAYLVYLGSRMLVGYTGANLARDLQATPDVVVARKGVPRFQDVLQAYVLRGRFVRESFPVTDLPFNNIPELTPGPGLGVLHQFRTPVPEDERQRLEIWVREDLERAAP